MGEKNYARRSFFKKLAGTADHADESVRVHQPDKLFEKYARKTLGPRVYSDEIIDPSDPNPPANRTAPITSTLTPYTGIWGKAEAAHLLRRVGFGVKQSSLDAYAAMTVTAAVDDLLTVSSATPAYLPNYIPARTAPAIYDASVPLNNYAATYPDSSGALAGDTWTEKYLAYATGNTNDGTVEYQRQISLSAWLWGTAINEGTNIREKMMQFWYHFIPVNFDDLRNVVNNSAILSYNYMKLLRAYATGNFKDMMKEVTKSPAMLIFLSNHYSTANTPNENYARELLELFTLGKAPTQNYTEDDIKATSRVLSGWKVTTGFQPPFTPVTATAIASGFDANKHNTIGPKAFSSFFSVPPATSVSIANNGAAELDTFFDLLFNPAGNGLTVAKYICRRLYRFFVYYDIDANTETNIIAPLATTFIANNWAILPVLKELFKSQHFYDAANRGVMIKSPVDLVTGAIRSLGIPVTVAAGVTVADQYAAWNNLQNVTNAMEQAYGLVPNVSGWKAYYQEPYFYQNWINTNSIQLRETMLNKLLGSGYTNGAITVKIDFIAAVQQLPNATIRIPDDLINALVLRILPVDLATDFKFGTPAVPATQNTPAIPLVPGLKHRTVLSNQVTDSYWTDAWDKYITPPANSTQAQIDGFKATVTALLKKLFTELLQLAEFQLM